MLSQYEHSPFGNYIDPSSEFLDFPDGILAWLSFLDKYDNLGCKHTYLTKLYHKANTKYHDKLNLVKWVDDQENIAEIETQQNLS